MVMSRLRSLERKLVFERTEVVVERLVDDLLLEWDIAECTGKPLPDPVEFIRGIMAEGFHLRAFPAATNYLSRCQFEGKSPDRRRLLQMLLPWVRH